MSYPLDPQETLDSISEKCGNTEANKGFREDWARAKWLDDLAEYLSKEERFTTDETWIKHESTVEGLRNAAKALRNNYVGTKFMLIVSEVAEAMESLRDVGADGIKVGEGNVGEELADTHIRLFALEQLLDIRPGQEVTKKMGINNDRPHKHGRAVI